jgi:hypothetical protein
MSAGPEELTRPLRRRTAGWDDQPERELEPTHHIATPPQVDEDDPAETPASSNWLISRLERCRFWYQQVDSLQDHLRFGRDAAISIAARGPWRTANIWFARLTTPFLIILFFAIWAYFRKLSRALVAWPLTFLIGAWLNHIPFVEWFVPDMLDPTTWTWPWSAPVDVCSFDPAAGGE